MNSLEIGGSRPPTTGSMGMSRTKPSLSRVASLQPQLEFEVIKHAIFREKYLKRVRESLEKKKGKVDLSVIGQGKISLLFFVF